MPATLLSLQPPATGLCIAWLCEGQESTLTIISHHFNTRDRQVDRWPLRVYDPDLADRQLWVRSWHRLLDWQPVDTGHAAVVTRDCGRGH